MSSAATADRRILIVLATAAMLLAGLLALAEILAIVGTIASDRIYTPGERAVATIMTMPAAILPPALAALAAVLCGSGRRRVRLGALIALIAVIGAWVLPIALNAFVLTGPPGWFDAGPLRVLSDPLGLSVIYEIIREICMVAALVGCVLALVAAARRGDGDTRDTDDGPGRGRALWVLGLGIAMTLSPLMGWGIGKLGGRIAAHLSAERGYRARMIAGLLTQVPGTTVLCALMIVVALLMMRTHPGAPVRRATVLAAAAGALGPVLGTACAMTILMWQDLAHPTMDATDAWAVRTTVLGVWWVVGGIIVAIAGVLALRRVPDSAAAGPTRSSAEVVSEAPRA